MLRAAAAMEHLPAAEKRWLGDLVCERLKAQAATGGPWAWSLARLGARVPLYGSVHNVVSPQEIPPWLELMMCSEVLEGSSFALAHLARRTGDRARDIAEDDRARVLAALRARLGAEHWLAMTEAVGDLKPADEARVFGDSVPLGLQLGRQG
jgi:hypothetical protein